MTVETENLSTDGQLDISFIVPAWNEAERIAACIESIVAVEACGCQSELIVMDNGSTDGTVRIASELGARVEHRPGDTISTLRNSGARIARGKYLAFIDADVLIDPAWIANAMREIKADDVAMVGSSPSIPSDASWVVRTWHLQVTARPVYGRRPWLASMNVLVDREIFLSLGGFDETLVTCEDVDLGYRISRSYEIINDARIAAVHLGEAKTLRELFRKESWRGSSNYSGALRHGIERGELPSLILPPLTLISGTGIATALFFSSFNTAILCTLLFFVYPIIQSTRIGKATRQWRSLPALIVVWSVYSMARANSMLVELRSALVLSARRRSSS